MPGFDDHVVGSARHDPAEPGGAGAPVAGGGAFDGGGICGVRKKEDENATDEAGFEKMKENLFHKALCLR